MLDEIHHSTPFFFVLETPDLSPNVFVDFFKK